MSHYGERVGRDGAANGAAPPLRYMSCVVSMTLALTTAMACGTRPGPTAQSPPDDANVVYRSDFTRAIGQEWSSTRSETTPSGRLFLGQFRESSHLSNGAL